MTKHNEHHEYEHNHHHCQESNCGCGCGCAHGHSHDHDGDAGRFPATLFFGGAVFLVGWILTALVAMPAFVRPVWMAAAAIWPFLPIAQEALEELRHRSMGENTLLVIAVVAAFAIGEAVDGTLVLLLFSLGEWLEHKAVGHSRHAVTALAAVTPDTALRLSPDGKREEIHAEEVRVGDSLWIPPHARVAADCRITDGASAVDTAALTGESAPRPVSIGDELLSGTVNGDGALTVEALRATGDSAAARILKLVEEATARKGRSERFITRFARLYTPIVTGLAVAVALLPPLLGAGTFQAWIYRALVFLVASCPCALVISVPLGFYAGIAAAARRGILLKGGLFVEKLARVQAVAYDKTGTLTTNALSLDRVAVVAGTDADRALALTAALEQSSTHPMARAICAAAEAPLPAAESLHEQPGIGIIGSIDGVPVACGGLRLLREQGNDPATLPPALRDGTAFLLENGRVSAAFYGKATLQEGAAEAVAALSALGVSRQVMLTGDRKSQADAVAKAVGLTQVKAELLPEDKLAAVEALQKEGLVTAFVGDGINDAPVLAAADIGIAMGLGSPAAIETADAVLISGGENRKVNGLAALPAAVRLCRRVMGIIQENIGFSLAVKAAVLVLAVCGIAPMWLAVFADTGVTLLCVANVLRLLSDRKAK